MAEQPGSPYPLHRTDRGACLAKKKKTSKKFNQTSSKHWLLLGLQSDSNSSICNSEINWTKHFPVLFSFLAQWMSTPPVHPSHLGMILITTDMRGPLLGGLSWLIWTGPGNGTLKTPQVSQIYSQRWELWTGPRSVKIITVTITTIIRSAAGRGATPFSPPAVSYMLYHYHCYQTAAFH